MYYIENYRAPKLPLLSEQHMQGKGKVEKNMKILSSISFFLYLNCKELHSKNTSLADV